MRSALAGYIKGGAGVGRTSASETSRPEIKEGEKKGRRGGGAPLSVPPVPVGRETAADDDVSFTQLRSLANGSLERHSLTPLSGLLKFKSSGTQTRTCDWLN